jgi:hypothetical protein
MLMQLERLRDRPTLVKGVLMLIYGVATFIAIYLIGLRLFDNVLFFRIFEILWFIHIVFICSKIQRSQNELILLAALALSPGIINNLLVLFE